MLTRLSIRDFVIVDAIELEFADGFTALTGETGAGKSILIDALALALGERAEAGAVRAGCERAEVTAEFDLAGLPAAAGWLESNQLEADGDVLFLRRTVDVGGRSRAFINGRSATVQQLKEIGEQLVDIHGQQAHQSLLRRDAQRALLDDFGATMAIAQTVAERFQTWQHVRQAREEMARNAETVAGEREQLAWQIRELVALDFEAANWQETLAEHSRLAHAASLIEAAEAALTMLSDAEAAVIPVVTSVAARLRQLADVDARLTEITGMLEPARIQLQEAAYGLRHYLQRIELDPDRLGETERRIGEVHAMARKYRISAEELPELLGTRQSRLGQLGGSDSEEDLLAREAAAAADYLSAANELSAGRKKAAAALSKQVTAGMQTLAMSGGRFEVVLQPLASGTARGLEQAEFQVAAHPGLTLGPLTRVASGGELSRISLAVQVILSRIAAVPTLIFDEVDAGIGGRVAEIVGQLLEKLGAKHQVMCVTHLPQVAARGDQHWQVTKSTVAGTLRCRIDVLDADARVEELARMLGGVKITDVTRQHAKEMLGENNQSMKPSRSIIHDVRGLRYHIRAWGDERHPKLFLLHGWMDVSASFQFMVDALAGEWYVMAPDWRGFGLSEWQKGGYYFADYVADLEVLLQHFSADQPVRLVGHSMGGNIACLYAGIRPERVASLVSLEGFGLRATLPEQALTRMAKWLAQLADPPRFKPYASFEALAERLRENNPHLSTERALFLAHHSGKALPSGEVTFNSDPFHKAVSPVLYRLEEAKACWRNITAPVLWLAGADSAIYRDHLRAADDYSARKACFAKLEEVVLVDAGHMMHHDQPEDLARLMEKFLAVHC